MNITPEAVDASVSTLRLVACFGLVKRDTTIDACTKEHDWLHEPEVHISSLSAMYIVADRELIQLVVQLQ